MITGIKSPYYVKMKCRNCPAIISRRKGVKNPLCAVCKTKRDRDRKREVLHICKTA